MEKTFMISQLMTQLSNMMKSEKYQQDKVMIIQLVVYWISFILQIYLQNYKIILQNYRLMAVHLSEQKALNADSRAIQQIIFTDK